MSDSDNECAYCYSYVNPRTGAKCKECGQLFHMTCLAMAENGVCRECQPSAKRPPRPSPSPHQPKKDAPGCIVEAPSPPSENEERSRSPAPPRDEDYRREKERQDEDHVSLNGRSKSPYSHRSNHSDRESLHEKRDPTPPRRYYPIHVGNDDIMFSVGTHVQELHPCRITVRSVEAFAKKLSDRENAEKGEKLWLSYIASRAAKVVKDFPREYEIMIVSKRDHSRQTFIVKDEDLGRFNEREDCIIFIRQGADPQSALARRDSQSQPRRESRRQSPRQSQPRQSPARHPRPPPPEYDRDDLKMEMLESQHNTPQRDRSSRGDRDYRSSDRRRSPRSGRQYEREQSYRHERDIHLVVHRCISRESQYTINSSGSCTIQGLEAALVLQVGTKLQKHDWGNPRSIFNEKFISEVLRIAGMYKSENHTGVFEILPNVRRYRRIFGEQVQFDQFLSKDKFRIVDSLRSEARKTSLGMASAVLTKPPESIFVHYTDLEGERFVLFDSHPRPEKRLNGAHCLVFDSDRNFIEYLDSLWRSIDLGGDVGIMGDQINVIEINLLSINPDCRRELLMDTWNFYEHQKLELKMDFAFVSCPAESRPILQEVIQENEKLKALVAKQGLKIQSIADDVRDKVRREMERERENQPRQPDPRSPVLDDEQIESYRRQMRQMEDDHDRRVRNLRKDLDDERDARRRLKEDITDLKSQLAHFRQKEEMMDGKIERLKQEKTGLEQMIADMKQNKDQTEAMKNAAQRLRQKIADQEREMESLAQQKETLQRKLREKHGELLRYQETQGNSEAYADVLNEQIRDLQRRHEELEMKVTVLESEKSNLLKENERLAAIVEAKRTPTPPPPPPTFSCVACDEELPIGEIFRTGNCDHVFCRECAYRWVMVEIENNRQPRCLHFTSDCDVIIHESMIQLVMTSNEEWMRYHQMIRNVIQGRLNLIVCPNPDCNMPLDIDRSRLGNSYQQTCIECRQPFCVMCKVPWHAEMTCDQYKEQLSEMERQSLAVIAEISMICPGCGQAVQKQEGCNHMRCSCDTDFCYKCGQKIDKPREDGSMSHYENNPKCVLFSLEDLQRVE